MPFSPLSDWSEGTSRTHMLEVFITMIFVDEAPSVLRRLRNDVLAKAAKPHGGKLRIEMSPDDFHFISMTQPFDIRMKAMFDADVMVHGTLAGDTLAHLIAIAESGDEAASLDKAFFLTSKAYHGGLRFGDNENSQPIRAQSQLTVRTCWERFRPVAHLWAAYAEMRQQRGPVDFLSALDPAGTGLNVIEFLSYAEAFRRVGEKLKIGHRRDTALHPERTWKAPSGLPLLPLKMTDMRLDVIGQRELKRCKARKRS